MRSVPTKVSFGGDRGASPGLAAAGGQLSQLRLCAVRRLATARWRSAFAAELPKLAAGPANTEAAPFRGWESSLSFALADRVANPPRGVASQQVHRL
jgi:hypothetical protein